MNRVHQSRGPVASGPQWPEGGGRHRAHRCTSSLVLQRLGAHRSYTKTKRRVHQFSSWALVGSAVAEECRRRGGTNSGGGNRCGASGGTEKWSWMAQIVAGRMAKVDVPFIGPER
jgi:hypothetical protein